MTGKAIVTVDDKKIDLVPLVGTLKELDPSAAGQWRSADSLPYVAVGEIAYTHGFGKYRRGIVTKVGRSRITVAFTTATTVAEATRRGHEITVYATPRDGRLVRVFRPAGEAR